MLYDFRQFCNHQIQKTAMGINVNDPPSKGQVHPFMGVAYSPKRIRKIYFLLYWVHNLFKKFKSASEIFLNW